MTVARLLLLATVIASAPAKPPQMPVPPARPPAETTEVTRTLLQRSDVHGTDLETRLYLITFPPGSSAARHTHPVVGLGYILKGEAISAFEGETPHRLAAGTSFADLAGTPHVLFRNASATASLVFVIAYTVRRDAPVTMFDPG